MGNKVILGDDFRPDYVKFYPCTPTDHSEIKEMRERGEWMPYAEKDPQALIDVLVHYLTIIPECTRTNRIYRDFPNQDLAKGIIGSVGGCLLTNLQQYVLKKLEQKGVMCRCIRCREVGLGFFSWGSAATFIRTYRASGGVEYFISVESKDSHILYGFVRLRFNPPQGSRSLLPEGTALIRELHVYGTVVKVDTTNDQSQSQHSGIGKHLMSKAEQIAIENGYQTIAVISGVGVRGYYKKLGYHHVDKYGYMYKSIVPFNGNPFNGGGGQITTFLKYQCIALLIWMVFQFIFG